MEFDIVKFLSNNIVGILTFGVLLVFLVGNGKIKKFKLGKDGIEAEAHTDADKIKVVDPKDLINPNDDCPHEKAYTAGRNATRAVDARVDSLETRIDQGFQNLIDQHAQREANERKILIDLKKQTMNIPTSSTAERVLAGLECVFLKENGDVKRDAIGISLKYPDTYRAITIVRPELRIPEIDKALSGES